MNEWADIFPGMDSQATDDPRIFCTKWKKTSPKEKTKKYFCCIVGGNCYGVDVIRPLATHTDQACEEAYFKVKLAADYFEKNEEWPGEN